MVISAQSAAGKNEADLLGIPYLSVTLMPWAIPWDDPERSALRRMAYNLFDRAVRFITTRPLNRIRREHGLSPVGEEGFGSLRLNLIPVSSAIYNPNPNWNPRHRMVGYWFVNEPVGWEPPSELVAFLSEDEPTVVVSLGSMSLGDNGASSSLGLFIDDLQQVGLRGVLQGWEGKFDAMEIPATIYIAGSIPHNWLLPRCAAIVHHGGFGTTAAGMRAGIPALVVPHIADQFFWARIVHELGAGPKPIPRSKLSLDTLVASLTELLQNGTLTATASALGRQVQVEKGIDEAVRLIEEEFK
jgi:sterol 3beta-glucosyltransferase